jgi:hypothetical protein
MLSERPGINDTAATTPTAPVSTSGTKYRRVRESAKMPTSPAAIAASHTARVNVKIAPSKRTGARSAADMRAIRPRQVFKATTTPTRHPSSAVPMAVDSAKGPRARSK